MITIRDYYRAITERLKSILGSSGEATAAAAIIFEDVAGYSKTFIFANGDLEITDSMQDRIKTVVDKIEAGEPVQYAVGKARFMGNDYIVTPDVLIPRPETAGLVDMITDTWNGHDDLAVLDIGTGSGCIALSLAKALPFSKVRGFDISSAAIEVAKRNSAALKTAVEFVLTDILTSVPPVAMYDIIVSNPPYVTDSEAAEMDKRVLDYEPHTALFVPDSDPLRFYKAIGLYARKALKSGGMLYFEINSNYRAEMLEMLNGQGFTDASVIRDFKGNYRYAIAKQP